MAYATPKTIEEELIITCPTAVSIKQMSVYESSSVFLLSFPEDEEESPYSAAPGYLGFWPDGACWVVGMMNNDALCKDMQICVFVSGDDKLLLLL